jgi:hypothetical protein
LLSGIPILRSSTIHNQWYTLTIIMAAKKKAKQGYSIDEMRAFTDALLRGAVDDLRVRLKAAWKKRAAEDRRVRHGTSV